MGDMFLSVVGKVSLKICLSKLQTKANARKI